MLEEFENNLEEAFPFMKKGESLKEQEAGGGVYDLYSAFGCDCDNGWYELLYDLCSEITEAYKKYGQPVDIVVDQIKEKYGTLRFYYHYKGSEGRCDAIDYPGGVIRFAPISDEGNMLHREISDIVIKWEKKSAEICEKCGKPGVLRDDLPWILTLCDDCYKKII